MLRALTILLCLLHTIAAQDAPGIGGDERDRVAYLGAEGSQLELVGAKRLSDGTLLLTGSARDLSWVPAGCERIELGGARPTSGDTGRTAFILQVSADLGQALRIASLPHGAAENVSFLASTEVPGEPTGTLFASGLRTKTADTKGGYWIARLDGNFVDAAPSALAWVRDLWADGKLRSTQPWDVTAAGEVYYAYGVPYGYDWFEVGRLTADGENDVVPSWRNHIYPGEDGKNHTFIGHAADAPVPPTYSRIALKRWGHAQEFRSWSEDAFSELSSDGNGGTKLGRWPLDAMYNGYHDPSREEKQREVQVLEGKRGYYGYTFAGVCANVSVLTVDRRNGDLYIGGNNKSGLPGGNPDFEPWLVAMDHEGRLRWWQRLYAESKGVSTPDQYIDAIAVDYRAPRDAGGSVVVVARCHGNNTNNFFQPSQLIHPQAAESGFQDGFTGTHGNMHFSWLGRLEAATGEVVNASYFAEYAEGTKHGSGTFSDPLIDTWPAWRSGWPDLNTTKVQPHGLAVDADGYIYVSATGRRVLTTENAYQQMPSPLEQGTKGNWSDFVRVYAPDLSRVDYSSLVNATWDWASGQGIGQGVDLGQVLPLGDGLLVVGTQGTAKDGSTTGNPVATRGTPAWTQAERPEGAAGVIGLLHFDKRDDQR